MQRKLVITKKLRRTLENIAKQNEEIAQQRSLGNCQKACDMEIELMYLVRDIKYNK